MKHSVLHPTLYTPATKAPHKLIKLANGELEEGSGMWRNVLCTEDSIREDEVPSAIESLRITLAGMRRESNVTMFVRVRNPQVMAQILDLPDVDKLRGFVVPKADPTSFPEYADQVAGTDFRLMPILESSHMIDRHFRETLRRVLKDGYGDMIDCVRIGANDLMGHLGIRRDDRQFTIYDTPVGNTIFEIINEFHGLADFTVTAPVFECFGPKYDALLLKEVQQHIMNGLFGQTVIHPRHVRIIRDLYKVSESELKSARKMIDGKTAVEGLEGKMDERATHIKWAERVVKRYELFGDSAVSQTLVSALS